MMKLYVPNPQHWVDFFERRAAFNQSGGARRPRVIRIKPPRKQEDQRVSIKAVLPTEQTTAQAKSELEREDINPKDVEKVFQTLSGHRRKSIKRKARDIILIKPKQQRRAVVQTTGKRRLRDIFED